jgi:uncharacterized protein
MRSKRVILDTNLWISFLISKRLDFIDDLSLSGKIILIFSNELIEEFLSVAKTRNIFLMIKYQTC